MVKIVQTFLFQIGERGDCMRDPNRIPRIMEEIENAWKEVPDWRFGQLMVNFISTCGDPFYWEDEKFAERLRDYTKPFN